MSKRIGVALLALPLLAAPARAGCCWGPFKFDAGIDFHAQCVSTCNGVPAQLGPWYLYWPLEAHFQVPSPLSYPYWGPPQGLPGGFWTSGGHPPPVAAAPAAPVAAPAPVPAPAPPHAINPAGYQAPTFQPVGYHPQVPSYWYGR
jgi:hypothetical protein